MDHTNDKLKFGAPSDAIVMACPPDVNPDDDSARYYGGLLVCESASTEWRRRIVACVNACKGIPTDILEHAADFGAAGIQTIEHVRKQRDELLAALEPFATAFKPAAEQLRKYGASDVMLTHLDRNTVTPTMTMGDFRRAFEAVTGMKCHGQQEKQAEAETTVPALVFFPAGSLGEEVEP